MRKEESILFPAIIEIEATVSAGKMPRSMPFGSVANFSRVLEEEHRQTAGTLREIRRLINSHSCDGRSDALITMSRRLQAMLTDVHRHIHLENNVLFPRAIELERRAGPQ